ncbi:MAG: transporter [Planctomycetia bacterium]|nr:transporter [Planctomycetia bacterium]MCC7316855.1 transporter [Planctomycetota bacterium]
MIAGFAMLLGSVASAEDATTQPADEPVVNFLGLEADPIDEPMVTDRPDFTESTLTVPRGRAQVELGYTYVYDDEDGVRVGDHVFPESLLRVGLAKDWELRVFWLGGSLTESMFRETNDAGRRVDVKGHEDGATDMSIGFKYHIREQDGWIPDMGVIGEVSIPTGTRSKTSGDVDPGAKFLWAYALTDRLSLSGNVNIAVPTGEKGRFFQTAASVSMGYSWTDWMGSFVEYFGIYPNDRGSDCAHTVNGGFTFPITDNLQFDVRVGVGLNEEADDLFAGSGLAIRF